MEDEWRVRLNEVVKDDGRSLRALSLAAGFGENYVQQMLKDKKDPSFTKLAKVLSVLSPNAALYVLSGLRPDADRQLRAALLSFGIDASDIGSIVGIITGYRDARSAERSAQNLGQAQSEHASPRREPEPSGQRPQQ